LANEAARRAVFVGGWPAGARHRNRAVTTDLLNLVTIEHWLKGIGTDKIESGRASNETENFCNSVFLPNRRATVGKTI
jgi:hypothetical protein